MSKMSYDMYSFTIYLIYFYKIVSNIYWLVQSLKALLVMGPYRANERPAFEGGALIL